MTAPITLRAATPTRDDGLAFAGYLDTAAEGFFRVMLGRRSMEIVAEAFRRPGHDLSHSHVTFAECDGSIVAMASGYSAEDHRCSSDDPLVAAAGRLVAMRMAVVNAIGGRMLRFIETVPDGDFYLQAVAVDDDRRGTGIGSMLIDAIEDRARAEGCARVVLDVAADNDAARRLYERRGMSVEAESPRFLFMPNSRALRMVKPLEVGSGP